LSRSVNQAALLSLVSSIFVGRLDPLAFCAAFPLGTMDTFTTYGGPANLLEAANTMGLPLYARQHLDEKGRWIDLMTEASILPVNKRPRIAIRIHTSN
jgi:hypothetical protein